MKDIAIIGYSGILPDANTIEQLADNLKKGHVSIGKISKERINDTTIPNNIDYCHGGYLEDISSFDHKFFEISLGEAEQITPHQRLLLQEAYKTFERANYNPNDIKGSNTSVYVGDTSTEYYLLAEDISPSLIAGNMKSLNASRISRFFDLRGSAYNIDTTCSSGLSALSVAANELYLEQTKMALVCGVNLQVFPQHTESALKMGVESGSGKCSPFSANADGTLSGEAVVCVLLKKLEDAITDNDTIHGVIKGIAINQDGASSASITAPSSEAQTEVINQAIKNAGIRPDEISYIEAHGTGTKLGDPIEIEGLGKVFAPFLSSEESIYLSAVKSNLGHSDSAAGLVGLIKILLSFKENTIYPSANALPLNEYIDFKSAKVEVVTEPISWNKTKYERKIAGISSFGLMGTNVHAIIEAYESNKIIKKEDVKSNYVCLFSAKSSNSLYSYIQSFGAYLETTQDDIIDITSMLNQKPIYEYRFSILADNKKELLEKIRSVKIGDLERSENSNSTLLLFDNGIDDSLTTDNYTDLGIENTRDENLNPNQKSLLIQYLTYKKILRTGLVIKDMLGYGLGKTVIKVIKNEISLEEALEKLSEEVFEIDVEEKLLERAKALINRYSDKLTILNIGCEGTLFKIFRKIEDVNVCSIRTINFERDNEFNVSLNSLFEFKNTMSFKTLYSNKIYSKVILPTYSFETTRCWLRSENNPLGELPEFGQVKIQKTSKEDDIKGLNTLEILIKLWEQVLKTKTKGEDDFFEMGGHSLNGQQLINLINENFNLTFDIDTLFDYGTPIEMAAHIEDIADVNIPANENVIEQIPIESSYEVSFAQKRLWLSSKLSGNTSSLNIAESVTITGELDLSSLKEAFKILIDRHESLRTNFFLSETGLRQKVLSINELDFEVEIENIENNEGSQINEMILNFHEKPFDLDKGALIRVSVFKLSTTKHILNIAIHHLVCDGWSTSILQQEVFHIYKCLKDAKPIVLDPLTVQYKDYTAWLLKKVTSGEFEEAKRYWLQKFEKKTSVLQLHDQKERPAVKTYNGTITTFKISDEIFTKLKRYTKDKGKTLTMMLSTFLNILLYKKSGKTDITLGLPIVERDSKELENQIGLYLNMIPLRMEWDENKSFEELLELCSQMLKEGYKHKLYPFELLVEELKIPINNDRFPLVDVVLSVQNFVNLDIMGALNKDNDALKVERYKTEGYTSAQFDLAYRFIEENEKLHYEIEYNTDLFSKETIEHYHVMFENIIEQCIDIPNNVINELELNEERHRIDKLLKLSGAKNKKDASENIVNHLQKIIHTYKDNIAVVYESEEISYKEIDTLSDKIALCLIDNEELNSGDSIILSMSISPMLIASILGILKAGMIYVPVDVNMPEIRRKYIREDVGSKLIIDDLWIKSFLEKEEEIENRIISFENIKLDDTAYIIYTSGSTGKPKGVAISHKNLMELMINCNDEHYDFSSKDVWSLYHSYSFDFSIWEIFGPLFFGGKLILLDRNKIIDFKHYLKKINDYGITVLNFTPRVFNEFENVRRSQRISCSSVRYLIFGGDILIPSILKEWKSTHPKCKLINMYGITEITVHGTFKELGDREIESQGAISNIGRPLQGLKFYILDEQKKLLPKGEVGEIYIGGDQLATGYYNNEIITNERFSNDERYGLGRLYRSGDLARWMSNGDLEYIGRIDDQINLNGFRIELNEVKLALLSLANIEEGHVTTYEDSEAITLVAYYKTNEPIDESIIKEELKKILPYYMIPNMFIGVDKLELNNNGKIDVNKLPRPLKSRININKNTAKEPIQDKVEKVFKAILNLEEIEENVSFFDMGGNSLQLVRLHTEIDSLWPEQMQIPDLFEYNSIKDISEFLNKPEVKSEESKEEEIEKVDFLEV
ncbi:amino acid adenylation domain-containing protein [Aquimarina rhabdastrellae]